MARRAEDVAVSDKLKNYRIHVLSYDRAQEEWRMWRERSEFVECSEIVALTYREMQRAIFARLELDRAINSVQDDRLRLVLQLRFVNGLTIEETAARLFIDERWLLRLQRKAIDAVKPMLLPQMCE